MCVNRIGPGELCQCRIAVPRTYTGIVAAGEAEPAVHDAALRIFRWHHPTIAPRESALIIAAWRDPGRLH